MENEIIELIVKVKINYDNDDRNEAIKKAKECAISTSVLGIPGCKAISAELQQSSEGGWISVKDKLPDVIESVGYFKSNIVAGLIDSKSPIMIELNTGTDENNEEWQQWYCHQYDDAVEGITHWQPLPKSPIQNK